MLSPHSNLRVVQNYQFDPKQVQEQNGFQIMHAKNLIINQMFTLKKLPLTATKNKQKYQLMLNQVTVLKQLNSINIVHCHKILKTTNNLYLVYDYCNGKTLQEIINMWQPEVQIDYKKVQKMAKEEVVNLQLIQMIGKQLSQVLKQLKKHRIVHSMLLPRYIYITQNYVLKVTNFMYSAILQKSAEEKIIEQSIQAKGSQFIDPFFLKNKHLGYYSDIYSFGKILQSLHNIYKKSLRYVRHKRLIDLIQKMTLQNPYQRSSIDQVYEYFFKSANKQIKAKILQKKASIPPQIRIKSIIQTNQRKYTQKELEKQQNSRQKQLTKSLSSVSQTVRKSKSQLKQNSELGTQLSDTSFNSSSSRIGIQKNYKIFLQHIYKKRNICFFLTELAFIISNLVRGNKLVGVKLSFMLQKRSTIEMAKIAKYLSKGSHTFLQIIPQQIRFKFTKTEDYYKLSKIIRNQLQQYRKILQNFVSSIQTNLSNLQIQDIQFKKQLETEIYNQLYYKKIIFSFLHYLTNQRIQLLKEAKVKDFTKILGKISLLAEIYEFDNFDVMFDMLIDQKIKDLQQQQILVKRFKMSADQLCQLLISKCEKVDKIYQN